MRQHLFPVYSHCLNSIQLCQTCRIYLYQIYSFRFFLVFFPSIIVFVVVTGLVCSAILKKLGKKANNVKEQILSTDLAEHAA